VSRIKHRSLGCASQSLCRLRYSAYGELLKQNIVCCVKRLGCVILKTAFISPKICGFNASLHNIHVKITVFWDVTSCRKEEIYRRFREICCHRLKRIVSRTWRWWQYLGRNHPVMTLRFKKCCYLLPWSISVSLLRK
jgi:hypothetical protein